MKLSSWKRETMKPKMRQSSRMISLLFIALFLTQTGFALDSATRLSAQISGYVLNSETGVPISGVHVKLDGGVFTTISKSDGSFEFFNLHSGNYSLLFSHIAYKKSEETLDIRDGVLTRLMISLDPVIHANRPISYRVERDKTPYRIDKESIRNSTWKDVGDALKTIPGTQIHEAGGVGSRKSVSIRGSRSEHVKVKMDGIVLNSADGQGVDLSQFPIDGVESIEVIPDVTPGAAGGTVNIKTSDLQSNFAEKVKTVTSVESQYPQALIFNLSLKKKTPKSNFTFYGSGLTSAGDFDYKSESGLNRSRLNNHRDRLNFISSFSQSLNKSTTLKFLLFGDGNRFGSPGPLYQSPTTTAYHESRAIRGEASISKNSDAGRLTTYSLSAGSQKRNYFSPEYQYNPATGTDVHHTPSDLEDKSTNFRFRFSSALKPVSVNNRYSANIEAEIGVEDYESLDKLNNGVVINRTAGRIVRNDANLSLGGEILQHFYGYQYRINSSIRYNAIKDAKGEYSHPFGKNSDNFSTAQLRLTITPDRGNISFHIGGGTAFSSPSFINRFLVESVFAVGNINLKPERVSEISGGINHRFDIKTISIFSSVNLFKRETKDLIVWGKNWRNQYFPENLDQSKATGIELSSEIKSESIINQIGYSFTFQDVINDTDGSIYKGKRIPFQAKMIGNSHIVIGTNELVQFRADLQYSSRRYTSKSNLDPNSSTGNGLEPYTIVDLSIYKKVKLEHYDSELRLLLAVENIFDSEYELLDRMPMPGRTFRVKAVFNREN